MGEPHVVTALKEKRAELAGSLIAAENLVTKLKADIAAVDRSLKVFDPSCRPYMIRPLVRRASAYFGHGQLTRLIFDTLRRSPVPMTLREIAAKIGAERNLDITEFKVMNDLLVRIRARLAAQHKAGTLAKEARGNAMEWRVSDEGTAR